MDKNEEQDSVGLNQIFEIINAKGDEGELREIVGKAEKADQADRSAKLDTLSKTELVDKKETT